MGPVCGHGARRCAPLGVRGGSSWACREAQAGACPLFSSCSRSSSRRPGLLPHEPGPGPPGESRQRPVLRDTFWGFICLRSSSLITPAEMGGYVLLMAIQLDVCPFVHGQKGLLAPQSFLPRCWWPTAGPAVPQGAGLRVEPQNPSRTPDN